MNTTMNNAEIRIKIAESLSWKQTPFGEPINGHPQTWRILADLPNYPESLDACAEFEAANWDNHKIYLRNLIDICQTPEDAITATPLQRCLAYLRTKNLIP